MNSTNSSASQTTSHLKLHKILRRMIQERGWSVSHFCRNAELPRQTVHNWLSGQMPGDFEMVKRAADALEVSLDKLCFDEDLEMRAESTSLPGVREIGSVMTFEVVVRRTR